MVFAVSRLTLCLLSCAFVVALGGCSPRLIPEDLPAELNDAHVLNTPGEVLRTEQTRKSYYLWQLPSQGARQNMSYVILTPHGSVVVIDGGWEVEDTAFLTAFLEVLGNHVNAWFLTHPHPDHVGALTGILKSPRGLSIDHVYASLNETKWVEDYEPGAVIYTRELLQAVQSASLKIETVIAGQALRIDGIQFDILGAKNPEIVGNAVNNSSVVIRVSDSIKSVLFLGDLGEAGGDKLLTGPFASALPSDYVQMAHHGQNGVKENFYHAVHPRFCLWPTPKWLWDNDDGHGKDSGKWQTHVVRHWMRALGIEKSFPSYRGLFLIR